MGPSAQLEDYLNETQTPYLVRHHPRSTTALQLAEIENVPPHEVTKVVILTDSEQSYMMVLPADYQLDLQAARETIGSPEAVMANENQLMQLFPDCEVGAMPPFGTLYDMPVFVDESLADEREIEFAAGSHEDAVRMSFEDWERMVHPAMAHFGYKVH